jgi:hypothetical protein
VSTVIRQGIYEKLAATGGVTSLLATTTSIYHGQAPPNAAYPLIVFWKQNPKLRTRVFGGVAFESEVWMVKAVDRNTTSNAAEAISEAVSTTLTNGTITVSGRTLQDLFPTGDLDYLETDGDQTYRHHGVLYRVVTS